MCNHRLILPTRELLILSPQRGPRFAKRTSLVGKLTRGGLVKPLELKVRGGKTRGGRKCHGPCFVTPKHQFASNINPQPAKIASKRYSGKTGSDVIPAPLLW